LNNTSPISAFYLTPAAQRSEAVISCVDLFCGIGGLTHGLALAGVSVVAGIDNDPDSQFAYQTNNTSRFLLSDVASLSPSQLRNLWPKRSITLLAGCAPCQPFSTYSQKSQSNRRQSDWALVSTFGNLIAETKPDLVSMENVPHLQHHRVFQQLLTALSSYHVFWSVVECSGYGVPQTRKRLVLLASRFGPIQLGIPSNSAPPTVRSAIEHLPVLEAGEAVRSDPLHAACKLSQKNLRRIKASVPGGTWRDWPARLRLACHKRSSGVTYPSVYGRMEWDAPAPTITTQCFGYGNGRFGHPDQNRAITLREAALLQTFPASYHFLREGERVRYSVQGRLIGNAVPVKLAESIGAAFVKHVRSCGKGL
jgi:DNA (cytosine-5)-methyltransferase 1